MAINGRYLIMYVMLNTIKMTLKHIILEYRLGLGMIVRTAITKTQFKKTIYMGYLKNPVRTYAYNKITLLSKQGFYLVFS